MRCRWDGPNIVVTEAVVIQTALPGFPVALVRGVSDAMHGMRERVETMVARSVDAHRARTGGLPSPTAPAAPVGGSNGGAPASGTPRGGAAGGRSSHSGRRSDGHHDGHGGRRGGEPSDDGWTTKGGRA